MTKLNTRFFFALLSFGIAIAFLVGVGYVWLKNLRFNNDKVEIGRLSSEDGMTASSSPNIVFEEATFSFGTMYSGDRLRHVFKFKNTGNGDLIIYKVASSCRCNIVDRPDDPILPGATGEIEIVYTPTRPGKGEQTVTVYSNDPDNQAIDLKIRGLVKRGFVIKPLRLFFGDVKIGDVVSKQITITPEKDISFDIQQIEVTSEHVTFHIVNKTTLGKRSFVIDTTLNASGAPVGRFDERMLISTTCERFPRIVVPIAGRIKGSFEIIPERCFFGLVTARTEVKRELTVVGSPGQNMGGLQVKDDVEWVSTEVLLSESDVNCKIIVTLHDDAPVGKLRGRITIHVEGSDVREPLTVPIYGIIVEQSLF